MSDYTDYETITLIRNALKIKKIRLIIFSEIRVIKRAYNCVSELFYRFSTLPIKTLYSGY